MTAFWLFLAIAIVARSPIGRAIADRIAGRTTGAPAITQGDLEAFEARIDERLVDLEERLEVSERLLLQYRSREELPPLR